MIPTIFYSHKGGSGTTVTAAALAVHLASDDHPVRFVSPDAFAVLGLGGSGSQTIGGLTAAEVLDPAWLEPGADVDLIIDAGTVGPTADLSLPPGHRILVTRPCFLALRRVMDADFRADAVVLVNEEGRALSERDVTDCLGLPVVVSIPVDPSIARAVDAGLLAVRPPKAMRRGLDALARSLDPTT